MSFEVGVVERFNAQHHLVGDFGPASAPHEHRYRVEVRAAGSALQADGTLLDIAMLQASLSNALEALEGRDLNTMPELATPNPTAEVVARYLFERVAPALAGAGLSRLTLVVWESDAAFASYTADPTTSRR